MTTQVLTGLLLLVLPIAYNLLFALLARAFDYPDILRRPTEEILERLRAELGYGEHERVCLVTVGGSGVGEHLLRKVIASHRQARALVPELRMIVVCGPRIDPHSLPDEDGLELRAYVHDLYKHLGACDVAVVQGGLTTAMELTANRRPFIYFPLKHHFEQNFHVRHRLDRYGAGRHMDFEHETPETIAAAIAETIINTYDAAMGAYKALEMATIDGARACLWADQIGSLEAGKRADIVVVGMDELRWHPNLDPVRSLVYAADGEHWSLHALDYLRETVYPGGWRAGPGRRRSGLA